MPPRAKRADTPFALLLARIARVAVGVTLLGVLLKGGEYTTKDLFEVRARRDAVRATLARQRIELDSLKAEYKAVTTDPVRLEQIARERFGMVQGDKEVLYWVGGAVGGDSATTGTRDSVRLGRDSLATRPKPSQ